MSIGPFQNLPGSHEMSADEALANGPWLLPISDEPAKPMTQDDVRQAVRKASRPFWLAANGIGVAMALALTLQATTGFIAAPTAPHAVGPVADATPPTIAVQKASFSAEH